MRILVLHIYVASGRTLTIAPPPGGVAAGVSSRMIEGRDQFRRRSAPFVNDHLPEAFLAKFLLPVIQGFGDAIGIEHDPVAGVQSHGAFIE